MLKRKKQSMSKVLLILPIGTDDKSILLDCLSAWHGAISGANGIDLITYPVSYSDITDEEIGEVIKCIKNENALIGVVVYGDIPSSICLTKFHEKKSRNLPVITVANVSPYPKGVDFAFRMWFDIASLCQSVRRMVDHAAIDDKSLCLVYNATDYGEAIKKSLEDRFEFGKSVSYGDSGVNGQLKPDEVSKFSGVILIGFGSGYDKSLLELDEIYNRVGITGIVFTDNYITDKHLACKHLRICGLAVDQIVPDLELNKLEGWLKSDCELHNSIQTSLSVKNKFSEIISNSCQGELDQGFSSVEPPIYFATKDAVSFFARLSASGLDQESVLAKFRKKQFRQMTLGSAIIQPLGETKIDLNYKWIGQIPANFLKESIEYSTHEAISMVFNSVENILDNWSPCKKFPYDLFLSICKILSENLNITSVEIENLPNDETSVYNELALDDLKRFKAFSLIFPFFKRCIPIQFNGGKRILADNDALNVYLVIDADDVRPINSDGLIVDGKVSSSIGIIMAKNRHTAEYLWEYKNLPDSVDKTLTEIREEGGLVFLPETISDFNPQSKFVIRNNDLFVTLKETCIQIQRENRSFTYIVSEIGSSENSQKPLIYVLLMAKRKLSCLELSALKSIVGRLFALAHISESWYANEISNTKSAIGSIMSRNGSHNIGSHVLAALSHNVGTMPDDQMLYQYIQHRMDYIATATTERPTWTQPTMFVGDMMRRFLSQRHLLNYISRSEGLKAWEFQSDKAAKDGAGGHIKFHIRKVNKAGKVVPGGNYVDYDDPNKRIDLAGDVSLAIPGGIVGQHAFFTIIENIVRNAAKHDWVTPPTATQKLKFNGGDAKNPRGNLDIYIDFEDDPNNENVHFTIWTRLSDVMDGKTDKHKTKELNQSLYERCTEAEWAQWLSAKDIKNLPLHWHQEVELARPFIDGNGGLRRENWGLAEMKISAGYLQKAKIEDIGGISNGGHDIIIPSCVTDERVNDNAQTLKGVYHLGYKFDVPKAKLILLVVDKWPKELTDKLEVDLKRNGIYVRLADDLDEGKELSYQYVVMDSYIGDKLNWMLPFRIIVTKERDPSVEDKVPYLFKSNEKKTVREFLKAIIKGCGKNENICDSIVESVCACWTHHIISERRKQKKIAEIEFIERIDENGKIKEKQRIETKEDSIGDRPLSLVVYTEGGDSGAGETLVTDLDIVEYAFNEGIDGALDGFLNMSKNSAAKSFVDKLKGLKKWERDDGETENKLVFDRKRVLELIKNNDGQQDYSTEAIIKKQLRIWLELCAGADEVRLAIDYLDGKSKDIQKIEADIATRIKDRDVFDPDTETWIKIDDEINDLKSRLGSLRQALVSPIVEVVTYLCAYCLQIKGLISKYSEKIATLPRGFSAGRKPDNGMASKKKSLSFDNGWEVAGLTPFQETMLDQGETERMPVIKSHVLRYWRHQTKKMKSERYLEGLSGTQSYLSTLENIEETKKVTKFALITRLVENALLRILIIDERTREFLEKHEALKNVYLNMGIYVADDKKVSEELDAIEKGADIKDTSFLMTNGFVNLSPNVIDRVRKGYPGCKDKEKAKETARNEAREKFHEQFDIIIIHQGIIDKWLPGASHDKGKVELFIESLRCVFRYVVITTGRGTPANIPKSARVLPFSTIQTTLFRQYPEKMILTDAIMNMLPVNGAQNE